MTRLADQQLMTIHSIDDARQMLALHSHLHQEFEGSAETLFAYVEARRNGLTDVWGSPAPAIPPITGTGGLNIGVGRR